MESKWILEANLGSTLTLITEYFLITIICTPEYTLEYFFFVIKKVLQMYSRVLFQVLHESIFESTFGVFLKHFLASFLAEIIKTFGPALWLVFSFNLLFCIYNGQKVLKKVTFVFQHFVIKIFQKYSKVLRSTPKSTLKILQSTFFP